MTNLSPALADSNCQVIYIAAHGDGTNIGVNLGDADGFVPIRDVAQLINRGRGKISLIFGFCHAMDDGSPIPDCFSTAVWEVFGFKGEPTAADVVGLAAGILRDKRGFIVHISEANNKAYKAYGGAGRDWIAMGQHMYEEAFETYIHTPGRNLNVASPVCEGARRDASDRWRRFQVNPVGGEEIYGGVGNPV